MFRFVIVAGLAAAVTAELTKHEKLVLEEAFEAEGNEHESARRSLQTADYPQSGKLLAINNDAQAINEPCYTHSGLCDGYAVCCVAVGTCDAMISSNLDYYEGGCHSLSSSKKSFAQSASPPTTEGCTSTIVAADDQTNCEATCGMSRYGTKVDQCKKTSAGTSAGATCAGTGGASGTCDSTIAVVGDTTLCTLAAGSGGAGGSCAKTSAGTTAGATCTYAPTNIGCTQQGECHEPFLRVAKGGTAATSTAATTESCDSLVGTARTVGDTAKCTLVQGTNGKGGSCTPTTCDNSLGQTACGTANCVYDDGASDVVTAVTEGCTSTKCAAGAVGVAGTPTAVTGDTNLCTLTPAVADNTATACADEAVAGSCAISTAGNTAGVSDCAYVAAVAGVTATASCTAAECDYIYTHGSGVSFMADIDQSVTDRLMAGAAPPPPPAGGGGGGGHGSYGGGGGGGGGGTAFTCPVTPGPCAATEPTAGADMTAPATDSCDGTVGDAACTHACTAGYENGSITCQNTDGTWNVVACTAITCAKDESVTSNACEACATGKTRAAGDLASGVDTACTTPPTPATTTSDATRYVAPLLGLSMILFSLA